MRDAKIIYEETKEECHKDNCQSLEVMAILAIDKARKELFNYIYDRALEQDNDMLEHFMNKIDLELNF